MGILGKIVPFSAGIAVATLAYTNTYDSLWKRVDTSINALRNIQKQIPNSSVLPVPLHPSIENNIENTVNDLGQIPVQIIQHAETVYNKLK